MQKIFQAVAWLPAGTIVAYRSARHPSGRQPAPHIVLSSRRASENCAANLRGPIEPAKLKYRQIMCAGRGRRRRPAA
jgi:hypothetical protein